MTDLPQFGVACDSDHCITCADDGVPMTVLRVDEHGGLAHCTDDAGAESTVEITLVEPVAVGDQVLVHAGVAIAHLHLTEVRA